ncbi:MAG: alanine dehydrogenase [Flavobacteriales bacterium]|nr:alanine dehydrogenase [Flavobacteriales bacterium]
MKIGIIREGKNPPDKRVPLSPQQVKQVMQDYPEVSWVVQNSEVRKYQNHEYESLGVTMSDDLSDCDILFGVKEVPIDQLIPNSTYFFFSHTYKLQPYNAKLLKAILDKKIRLVDYEMIKEAKGKRLIGFGRYAGIVGCFNGIRTYGLKHGLYELKAAHLCEDRKEMEAQLDEISLPANTKIVLTGFGRVGHGAREILHRMNLREVEPEAFLTETFDEPVFTHLETSEYNARTSDGGYDKGEFYKDPMGYESTFMKYAEVADMYVACHYWAEGSPFIFNRNDVKKDNWNISVVADISCDIDGPVATTIRPSTIADPIYGVDKGSFGETAFTDSNAVAVMAVDNLPCELPKDASEDFGQELIKHVLPVLLGEDPDKIIFRATETTLEGELTPHFAYLADYAAQAEG